MFNLALNSILVRISCVYRMLVALMYDELNYVYAICDSLHTYDTSK